jgi:hypothetical protein
MILALSSSALGMTGTAAAAPPGSCPDILPVGELVLDSFGRGWTVAKGDTPEPFRVEYLGVLDDGIGVGRDLIIVEVSDIPGSDIIQRANGIWAGISGSPVYSNGKLVGAVSYSLNLGEAFLAGVTPAQDMARVLDYPASTAAAASPARIVVPRALQAKLAQRTGVAAEQTSSFDRLPLPLAVSGLSARNRDRLQGDMDKAGTQVIVTPGGKASPFTGVTSGIARPGGNFAALVSYGDVTAGGIGTTTYVCDGRALAFGHPAFFTGRSSMGANDASALAIVPGLLGSYKLANVTEPLGTVDQDRLAALRANLGVAPRLIPITSSMTSLDLGITRDGRTDVASPSFLPVLSRFHLYANFASVLDAFGPGGSKLRWTIRGSRANGDPFELRRGNRYASREEIDFYSVQDLSSDLATIFDNPFENVKFASVDVDAEVTEAYQVHLLETVKISKNGGVFRARTSLRLRVNDQVVIRASLRAFRGETMKVDVAFTVQPDAIGDGYLRIGRDEFDFSFPGSEAAPGRDFQTMLTALDGKARNDDLSARLQTFGATGIQETLLGKKRLDRVVSGLIEIPAVVMP